MRSNHLLFAGIFVLGVGSLLTIPYFGRMQGWLPSRWETVDAGPVEGVTWERFRPGENLRGAGPVLSRRDIPAHPNAFVYRYPEGIRETSAFQVVDGHEVPLPDELVWKNANMRGIQPVREYPPGTDSLELVIRPKGLKPSRFRVYDLPLTMYGFSVEGPETAAQTFSGLPFEATAWTAPPKQGCYPYVAVAFRVNSDLPAGDWEWRGLQIATPFQSPYGASSEFSMTSSMVAASHHPSLGEIKSHPWARRMPRVRLSGRLAQFQTMKEIVDFGYFDLWNPKGYAKRDFGIRDLTKPVFAKTPSGLRFRLEPVKTYGTTHAMKDAYLGLRLFVENGTARKGFPAAENSQGELDIRLGFPGDASWAGIGERGPISQGTDPNLYLPRATYSPGKFHLRFEVTRRVAVREIPFELAPNVRHLPASPASTHWMEDSTTFYHGGTFEPKPDDFPIARTAHNGARREPR